MKKFLCITTMAAAGCAAALCFAAETKGSAPAAPSSVALYDTLAAVDAADSRAQIPAGTWTKIAGGEKPGSFRGDAALVNDKVAAVVHRDGSGVDLYAKGPGGWGRRAHLAAVAGKDPAKTAGARVVTHDAATVGVETGAAVFHLNAGEPVLKTTPKGKADALRIASPCRVAVLPDFFADDLLLDAREMRAARTEIPGGNILLCMTGNGGAIVAALRDKNERDMEVSITGEGANRQIASSDIPFGTGGSVWTAVLEGNGIWFSREFARDEVVKGVPLTEWTIPFLANWKGDFMREDKNSESMPFSPKLHGRGGTADRGGIEKKNGKLTATVSDMLREIVEFGQENPGGGKDYVARYVGISGVGVIYPLTRTDSTPLDQLCVADLMRLALGTGPCESILDLESRQPKSKGVFTCSYGGMWQRLLPSEAPYYSDTLAKRMKEQRYFFRRVNRNVMTFVRNVQDRINTYVEFGIQMTAYLDEQEKKRTDLAEFIGKVRAEWAKPVWQYGKPYPNTVKCANEQVAMPLVREFDKALRIDTPDQAMKARGASALPGEVGDPGDRRLANLRRKVMLIRAMATMEIARNPDSGEAPKKIRAMAEAALRNPHSYERVTVW